MNIIEREFKEMAEEMESNQELLEKMKSLWDNDIQGKAFPPFHYTVYGSPSYYIEHIKALLKEKQNIEI